MFDLTYYLSHAILGKIKVPNKLPKRLTASGLRSALMFESNGGPLFQEKLCE